MSLQPEGTMAFMPFYFERFAWSTRGWPAEAAYAYLMLLCEQYTAGRLPADPQVLDRISPGTMRHWDLIAPKVPICDDGYRRNMRCVEHRAKTLELAAKRRDAAKAAADARYGKQPHAQRMPDACESDASRMPSGSGSGSESGSVIGSAERIETISLNGSAVEPDSSIGDTKPGKRRPAMPPGALERLWNLFPRKVGKGKALILLERAIRDFADDYELDELDDGVDMFREHIERMAKQYRNADPRFVPHPATWLGQKRYLDPVPEDAR